MRRRHRPDPPPAEDTDSLALQAEILLAQLGGVVAELSDLLKENK